jgi:2-amino-4-hydroxy-6-hydroxymethyldihydropteridine diphosphokinase
MKVYLGLGSNLGNKAENLRQAIELLAGHDDIRVIECSQVMETVPYGIKDQPDFFNQVILIDTALSAEKLLEQTSRIEARLKRVRTRKWGPRTIDIDILFYGDMVIKKDNLKVPHPDLVNREFVLQPLSQIAASLIHPVLGLSINELYNNLIKESKKK